MTYEEAARILGPDGVRRAEEFVASLPPMTSEQVELIAHILQARVASVPPEAVTAEQSASDAA